MWALLPVGAAVVVVMTVLWTFAHESDWKMHNAAMQWMRNRERGDK